MSVAADKPAKVWTEDELQALSEDGYMHEVIQGELVMSPKNNLEHGEICARLLTALRQHAVAHRLGVVLDSSTGFWMANRNCRAPDVAFVSKDRLRGLRRPPRTFFEGAPDLAIEILSPSASPEDISERLRDFFESGTRLAWVIHPDRRFVEICHSLTNRKILGPGAQLEGLEVLPGFLYPIDDLFKEWDWD